MWGGIGATQGFSAEPVGRFQRKRLPLLSKGAYLYLKCHRLVDQHDGDSVSDEIGAFSVLANEQGLEIRRDLGPLQIVEGPLAGLVLKSPEHGILSQPDRLEGLRAAEDRKELRIDRGGAAHRVRPGQAYFFFLRRGRPVRSFSVTS